MSKMDGIELEVPEEKVESPVLSPPRDIHIDCRDETQSSVTVARQEDDLSQSQSQSQTHSSIQSSSVSSFTETPPVSVSVSVPQSQSESDPQSTRSHRDVSTGTAT